jgi:hypothetical protein
LDPLARHEHADGVTLQPHRVGDLANVLELLEQLERLTLAGRRTGRGPALDEPATVLLVGVDYSHGPDRSCEASPSRAGGRFLER